MTNYLLTAVCLYNRRIMS